MTHNTIFIIYLFILLNKERRKEEKITKLNVGKAKTKKKTWVSANRIDEKKYDNFKSLCPFYYSSTYNIMSKYIAKATYDLE